MGQYGTLCNIWKKVSAAGNVSKCLGRKRFSSPALPIWQPDDKGRKKGNCTHGRIG
jgi:hypothetical protein